MDSCPHAKYSSNLGPRKLRESSHTSSCNFCRTLGQLNAKIFQQRTLHQNLLVRRDKLLSRFNSTHPTTIDRLPVEVASIIFTFYVSVFPQDESPFTLGAVCRKWRQIVWNTPEIWSSFTIYISKPHMSEARIQLAKEWLRRSGTLPLLIRFHAYSLDKSAPKIAEFYPLIDVVNHYSNRWCGIYLQLPSTLFARFDISTALSLREIDLYSLDNSTLTIHTLIQDLPCIVQTRYLCLDPPSLNWSHVTHFTSRLMPVDQVLQVLRLSPSLHNCVFGLVDYRQVDSPDEAFSHVTHHMLESLDITLDFEDYRGLFFGNVTLPALRHLSVQSDDYEPIHPDQLASFFTRSSGGLRSLEIIEQDIVSDGLICMTRATPLLEKLTIIYSTVQSYLTPFYRALSSHLPTEDNSTSACTEPLLKSLREFDWLGVHPFPWEFIPMFFAPLSQYDDKRRRPLEKLNIRCELKKGDPIPYIREDVLSQLLPFIPQVQFHFQVPVFLSDGHCEAGNLMGLSLQKNLRGKGANQG